ncbi:hypothetical protein ASPWEDRAFT_25875 [Aspergillus wentii DTO 134E9]|uniref:BTB domain-containing protein n=1 Tax=Aspergillus wentii DTO 134E9 TaxID=1073089 RepID=A0A1L9RN99_ASPWE|nr:uncharacterized protein ASPWEDRAFT_25875 [Aspergillus wentii DTO 134E9]KAI9926054.1 hypothetical protein MW887_004513 [Aspergillus wentii]OJJ36396.1 hypothetical protein ASPWEDRAFT_25875 [Aspergillus wentii DTO 134E9]
MSRSLGKSVLSGGFARLTVGKDEVPFDVHLELLRDCSPYFEDLFKHRGAEDITEQPVSFPDDDPDLFAQAISWMYRGSLAAESDYGVTKLFLLRLWVLAGKLQMAGLQNKVMSVFKIKLDRAPHIIMGTASIDYVYAHTLPDSPLRRLAVDEWARNVKRELFLFRKEKFPRAFVEDLCCALIAKTENTERTQDEQIGFEQRYFVHPTPSTDKDGDALPPSARESSELVTRATSAQMESRRVLSPVPRVSMSSLSSCRAPSQISPTDADSQLEGPEKKKVKIESA